MIFGILLIKNKD